MTFSIAAICKKTNQLGVAVTTKVPAVGSLCPFVKAGVGAIATQSFVNPYIGINGLKYLEQGMTAQEVKELLIKEDPEPSIRQFTVVDKNGNTVAFTGEQCDGWFGDVVGDGFAIAGNMLVGEKTILETQRGFEENQTLPLADRLIKALEEGQAAGGDKRGRQSAAVLVYSSEDYPLVDLRVDEHEDPVSELRRIYEVAKRELFPFHGTLPTKANPKGKFDKETQKQIGILIDQ
ncbi:Uncharacterized conserved protein, Ntn-hydrolase superfamily [Bhargavaea ginsengi]|uniref:Uncharacterized conserved protein, Ntn-hydrolase superfamily n=1 Tax=Bhargavaea ginsengi TaxID=426757 RepID=A0A1H6UDB9_9BACL|nr:DUF1028 domain-containing protein [Bhargavaea ginsengi]SEI90311.1 Uncharacterized conserved protein, Ntn-hydrolase superfamily [Bhargavaea ginsengi]